MSNKKRCGLLSFVILTGILFFITVNGYTQPGLRVPPPPKTVTLFEPELFGLEGYAADSTFFARAPKSYVRKVKMDSTAEYISIMEALDGVEFYLPAVIDLDAYVRLRIEFDRREQWKKTVLNKFRQQTEQEFGAIKLDIPIRIRSKTFTRIFGSDRIGLRVTGNITFDLSGRTEKRSGSATSASENKTSFSPKFNQTQQFTVEGKIGEKVTVSVDQNSEAVTDIENTLKLRYDGDEDEIVQKIEAGNVSLSLPSTKYVIFGGSNKGLFGLKADLKIGNFYVTTIASLEKGQQQELKLSGNASESKTTIKDYEFIKNRYFFVDKSYLEQFEKGFNGNEPFTYISGTDLRQLDIYKSTALSDNDARSGWAVLNPNEYLNANTDTIQVVDGRTDKGYFKRLDPDKDYTFDKYRGYFTLNQGVESNDILAVAYATSNGLKVGTLNEDLADTSQSVILKMIKPRAMQPTDVYADTWPLMMRNVYSLGGSNIQREGFDLRIQYNVTGNQEAYPEGIDRSFLNLMGLDVADENGNSIEGGDEKADWNPNTTYPADGVLIFPSLKPYNPDEGSPFKVESLPEKYKVDIYNTSYTNTQELLTQSKFEMIVTSKSTRSTYDLGFYVLEGSEVVTLNGRSLQRDMDYMIDYFSGQLTLLSDEAKRSSSNIEIKYERANLFQLDKKTILGGRAEYRFWDDSFIGFTGLYLNKSTIDQRVRVGQEPFRNLVWDINAAFKFRPRFLTKMVDAIPLVETNEDSYVNIETEFAQVLPDPNTLNNESTGDKDGVAYIDDFEASKRTTTLGIRYKTWTMASPPVVLPNLGEGVTQIDTVVNNARSRLVWFNPYTQVAIQDIWPDRDVNSQTGQTTDVLGLEYWRDSASDPDSAWAGVMRTTASFADQQKTKYIELWVQGTEGTINIDIGRISEDWYQKGSTIRNEFSRGGLNTEDRNNNGLLDDGEDIGLDGIKDGLTGDDPFDNWNEPRTGATNVFDGVLYDGINGTEGNGNAQGARYPDTEDLDGDGQLNLFNDYFEYTFSLDPNDLKAKGWVAGATEKGWRQFRIPLKDFTRKIGNPDPDFQQIFYTRLWVSDIPAERTRILIATFDFVGNEWEETGIAENDSATFVKSDSVFTLATYNTEENVDEIPGGPEPYTSPPGVAGERDRITDAISKEQSLVLKFADFPAGYVAEAKKTLYSAMELVNYKRLKMFIHGDRSLPLNPDDGDSSNIRFYLRFGSDVNNYYEYGQDVYRGWSTLNQLDIDLDELSQVKFSENKYALVGSSPGGYYKVKGAPSLNTIRYFIIGVKNKDSFGFTGEIWLDEMRLSEVRRENATALRLKTDIKLADLLRFNAEWESKDADYHDIGTQFGGGNTLERQNYSGTFTLDKFLPDAWDISIPIDARASYSRNVPKYFPRTDILTGYKNDSFDKKLKSLFGVRDLPPELDDQVSYSEVLGVGTTIRKRSKSKSWYYRYTVDELVLDFDYSKKHSSDWETKFNDSEQYKESIRYKIPFGKNNFVSPFKFTQRIPLLGKLSDEKLYYSPNDINLSLDISDVETDLLRRSSAENKRTINTSSTRSVNSGYRMFNSLNFTYSRSHRADADYVGLKHEDMFKEIFTKFNFGLDTDINQSFGADYRPNLIKWLKTDFSYNSNFSYSLTNNYQYKQSTSRVGKRIGLTLNPSTLVNSIYTPKAKKRTTAGRGRPTPQSQTDPEKDKKDEDDKKSFPNPLILLYKFFDSWQSIQMNYSIDDNISNPYLNDIPDWQYQFGFTTSTGVGQDSSLIDDGINLIGPSISQTRSIRTSTSYNFAKNIKATFNHDFSESESSSDYGNNRSGNRSISFLALGDDPLTDFKGLNADLRRFVPDWNVQVSGVEKYLFFPTFAQSVTVDHGHSGKYTENKSLKLDGSFVPTSQSFSSNWQPLVGFNIRTVWGVSGNIRRTESTSYSYNSGAGATKTETSSLTITMSYAKTAGFRIPIWPFKSKSFKNEVNFSLTFDRSQNTTFQKQFDQDNFEEKQNNKSWKLRPSASYRFNTKVQGSLFFETGATENKISGTYTHSEFGMNVNIAIRD
ncbi:MAG: cell surface protein SprA [Calditrichaceae bacterium]